MPTRGRQEWAAQALNCFRNQNYANKELVIVDDSDDPSFPEPPHIPGVLYECLKNQRSIPEKRNICGTLAHGQVIMNFDSDDWSAPERMSEQVAFLEESKVVLVGYNSMIFVNDEGKSFRYHLHNNYALGTSLCFRRDWWMTHHFPESKSIGSDNKLVRMAEQEGQIATQDVGSMMVARIHSGNSSAKRPLGRQWKEWDEPLPEGFIYG